MELVSNKFYKIEYTLFDDDIRQYNAFAINEDVAVDLLKSNISISLGYFSLDYITVVNITDIYTNEVVFNVD